MCDGHDQDAARSELSYDRLRLAKANNARDHLGKATYPERLGAALFRRFPKLSWMSRGGSARRRPPWAAIEHSDRQIGQVLLIANQWAAAGNAIASILPLLLVAGPPKHRHARRQSLDDFGRHRRQ